MAWNMLSLAVKSFMFFYALSSSKYKNGNRMVDNNEQLKEANFHCALCLKQQIRVHDDELCNQRL